MLEITQPPHPSLGRSFWTTPLYQQQLSTAPPVIEVAHGIADSSGAFEKQTADPAVVAPGR